jgi:hypothetical protein
MNANRGIYQIYTKMTYLHTITTYIGECKCIVTRLYHHNIGHGSTLTIPANRHTFAIMGYICGFDGQNKPLQRQLERQWKERWDFLISEGIDDPRLWF